MKYNNKKNIFINPHKKYDEEEKKENLVSNNITNKFEKKKTIFDNIGRLNYFSNKLK